MFVSLNWLSQYVDISGISPEVLAEKITKSGIEVDGIEYFTKSDENVVVGFIETCEKHPNADKLNVCMVDVGTGENLQIVCGAPNVEKGQKVIVAKPGAVLPGNINIKKASLRGVESSGMICSLQELGVDEKQIPSQFSEGIYVFPQEVHIGEQVNHLLNLDDVIFEFDLTPNRSDALSMIGVAYEVAAILDKALHLPEVHVSEVAEEAKTYISVDVDAIDLCPYYGAYLIKNVEVKPSPLWMQNYLSASGIRPINNVVDITNYVLLEYGQPLHAFDYNKLSSKNVLVRRAFAQEKLTTLDGVERTLLEDDLVITNGNEPIALAGVMGGKDTEVDQTTVNILLEAAFFDPTTIRKTVKHTGLRSEASTRYEKGIDPNRVKEAGLRACQLLETYADGDVLTSLVEYDQLDRSEKEITVDTDEVNKRLGTVISSEEIALILQKLSFTFTQQENKFVVHIPTRRGDISLFEDMLEEIARIYGYDQLPYTLPKHFSQVGKLTEKQQLSRKIAQFLQAAGLMEARTYSLTNKTFVRQLISPDIRAKEPKAISVMSPMTEDHQYLRLSLLPELLQSLSYNRARNQHDVALYEVGNIFLSNEPTLQKQPIEQSRIAGVLTGHWINHEWQQETKFVDFYVVKGILEGLFAYLNVEVSYQASSLEQMHPGRCATIYIEDQPIGFLGQLHPHVQKEMNLKETYVFDVDFEAIVQYYKHQTMYKTISKYPSIQRDVAFIMDETILAGEIQQLMEKMGRPLVKDIHVFDVYAGEHLPEGKKSVAFNLVYQDPNKTLKDEEVEASFQEIVQAVNEQFNTYIRS